MDRSIVERAKGVLVNNFAAEKGERALILADDFDGEQQEIARAFLEAARGLGVEAELVIYPSLGKHGMEPPEDVWRKAFEDAFVSRLKSEGLWESILEKREVPWEVLCELAEPYRDVVPSFVVALPYFSTSHTTFRKLLNALGTRYASMPLFRRWMLEGSASVPPGELAPLTERLASLLCEAEEAEIRAEGTHLRMSLAGREGLADTGDLSRPGSFSNLPAGEAFIAPVEGTAEGFLTVEWAPTRRLSSPMSFKIERGRVVKVEGEDEHVRFLEEVFSKVENASNVAELGIGTNPKASRPDNILEAEKILGTIHIAFGDNHSFGGRTKASFHQDYVVFRPTLRLKVKGRWVDIMGNGKLTI